MSAVEGLSPGEGVANRYEVIRLLGRGAVKNVYLALDLLSRTQVAVALLRNGLDRDHTTGSRFSREARAASVLTSLYVVRVFDAGKMAGGTRYMVTEAVLGRGLDEAIAYGAAAPMSAAFWPTPEASARFLP